MNMGLVSAPLFLHWLQSLFLCFTVLRNCFQGPGELSWKLGQVFTAVLSTAEEKPNSTSLGMAVELLGRATVFGAEWAKPVP